MSLGGLGGSPINKGLTLKVGGQAPRTYKSGGGAQRTINVGGSGKTFHDAKRTALYRALNNRRVSVTNVTNNSNTNASSNINTTATIFGALTAAAGLGLGIAQMAKGFSNGNPVTGAQGFGNATGTGSTGSASSTSFSGKLGNAKSFGEINSVKQEIESKKASLKEDYASISMSMDVEDILKGEGVEDGLKLAGVQISPDQFKLDENIDSSDLDAAQKTIDSDINKMTNLQTSTLPKDLANITGKIGELGPKIEVMTTSLGRLEKEKGQIAASGGDTTQIDAQIKKLKEDIDELKGQKKNLESAKKAVEGFISQCGETIGKLKAKQAELADIQKTEASIKDKEYSLAESQDKELQQTMEQIDKLTKEINELADKDDTKATGSDQKRLEKYNKLIQQRTGLYNQLTSLVGSLSSADKTTFENSKGKTYTLKNLDKALQYGQNKPDVTATNGSAPGNESKPTSGNATSTPQPVKIGDKTITPGGGEVSVSLGRGFVNLEITSDGKYKLFGKEVSEQEFQAQVDELIQDHQTSNVGSSGWVNTQSTVNGGQQVDEQQTPKGAVLGTQNNVPYQIGGHKVMRAGNQYFVDDKEVSRATYQNLVVTGNFINLD